MKKNSLFRIMCAFTLCSLAFISSASALDGTLIESQNDAEQSFQNYVARKACETYTHINNSGKFRFPDVDEKGERECLDTESFYWGWSKDYIAEHGVYIEQFILEPDWNASDALRDLLGEGGVVDCSIITSLVTQLVSLDMLGDGLFDYLKMQEPFSLPSKGTLCLDDSITHTLPRNPGEYGYITNVADYREIHPTGFAAGQNVYCVGENGAHALYMGFGSFFATPKTKQEILDKMYEDTMMPAAEMSPEGLELQQKYSDRNIWEQERFAQQENFPVYCFSYLELEAAKSWFAANDSLVK